MYAIYCTNLIYSCSLKCACLVTPCTICFLHSVSVLTCVLEDKTFSCLITVLLCIKDPLSFVRYLNWFNCIYWLAMSLFWCAFVAPTLKVTYLLTYNWSPVLFTLTFNWKGWVSAGRNLFLTCWSFKPVITALKWQKLSLNQCKPKSSKFIMSSQHRIKYWIDTTHKSNAAYFFQFESYQNLCCVINGKVWS